MTANAPIVWTLIRALLIAGVVFALAVPARAATPQPQTNPDINACFLRVQVKALDGHPDRSMVTLWADEGVGMTTATVVMYARGKRFRITATDVVAADPLKITTPPTPIVVRFAEPTQIESAYVETMDGAACTTYAPYIYSAKPSARELFVNQLIPDWTEELRKLAIKSANAPATPASEPEDAEPLSCAVPFAGAKVIKYGSLIWPADSAFAGYIVLAIVVRPDGTLYGVRAARSSRQANADLAAAQAAARTTYAPQIYRCKPIAGIYAFVAHYLYGTGH